jgi:hypothetical protein
VLFVGGADLGSLRFGQDEHRESMAVWVFDDKTSPSNSRCRCCGIGRVLPAFFDRSTTGRVGPLALHSTLRLGFNCAGVAHGKPFGLA